MYEMEMNEMNEHLLTLGNACHVQGRCRGQPRNAKTDPIPAIDLDEYFDADFLASLAASLEGSSLSSGSSA